LCGLKGEAGSKGEGEGDEEVGNEEEGEEDEVVGMGAMAGAGRLLHSQCPLALAINHSDFVSKCSTSYRKHISFTEGGGLTSIHCKLSFAFSFALSFGLLWLQQC
jgi:hypothetical protein